MLKVNGWATMNGGTTGGKGGSVVTVNTAGGFRNEISGTTPKIIQVSGTIDIGYAVVGSNKTIVGIGTDAKTIGTIRLEGSRNIIIKNLNISNSGGDGIAAAGATNFFISLCTPNNCADGCIDVTKGSDYYTIEWCKFYYDADLGHNFPNLIGSSDTDPDQGKLKGTFHHNYYWKYCTDRMPRVRFGRQHVYNNYYDPAVDQKVSALITAAIGSEVLAENNHFESGDDAFELREDGKLLGRGNTYGSKYIGERNNGNATTVFTPPYPYSLQTADTLGAIVRSSAGVDGDSDLSEEGGGGTDPEPPIPPPVETKPLAIVMEDADIVELPKDFASFNTFVNNLRKGTYDISITATGNGETATDTKKIFVTGDGTTPPGDSLITGFKLIDAAYDKEVVDLVENGSYSLTKYGRRLNVKAIVADTSVKSVKFTLSGMQSKVYTDKAQPFALHGDDGNGNYYAGTWNPPPLGNYTLVAVPIDSAGKELVSSTVNFSFIK